MSTITVESELMVHEGGTKFYEIITFGSVEKETYLEVRRWGKTLYMRRGGGQTSVIKHRTLADMLDSARKQGGAKHKGGYQRDNSSKFGLIDGKDSFTQDEFLSQLSSGLHYEDASLIARLISELAVDAKAAEPTVKPVTEPVFEPSVDRGEAWGSW
jgi:hypothetical protein